MTGRRWGANEIAFIEDELAAMAEAYGLEVEEEVAKGVEKRQAKRRKKRNTNPTPSSINEKTSSSVVVPVSRLIEGVLPNSSYELTTCVVPGCKCRLQHSLKQACFVVSENKNNSFDLTTATCQKCNHGIFQHTIAKSKSYNNSSMINTATQSSSSLQGKTLLQELFEIIKFGRICSTVYNARLWTSTSLNLLLAQVREKKNVLTRGGIQDQDQKMNTSRLLQDLHSVGTAAVQVLSVSTRSELPVRMAIAFDKMYFQTYYTLISTFGRSFSDNIQSPGSYFQSIVTSSNVVKAKMKEFNEMLGGERNNYSTTNFASELSKIYDARLVENVLLMYENNIGMDGEFDAVLKRSTSTNSTLEKFEPLPAYPLLQAWRDNCRDWTCHLYAFATPNAAAMNALKRHQPIIEIGAGTGYWCSLMEEAGIQNMAYDVAPTTTNTSENEFHGSVPPFCNVLAGGPDVLSRKSIVSTEWNLFLCYPPPGSSMARDCLRKFNGTYVIYVGEWMGDTADRRFENDIQRKFNLVERIALPNWTNTAYDMTIWKRKTSVEQDLSDSLDAIISCTICNSNSVLKRCKICRTATYCSEKCMKMDEKEHRAEHAKRLVFLNNESALDFNNPTHFENLESTTSTDDDDYVSNKSWSNVVNEKKEDTSSFKFGF